MAKGRRRTGNRSFPKRSRLWLPFEVFVTLADAGTVVETGDMLANYFAQTGEEVPVGSTVSHVRGVWGISPVVVTSFDLNYRVEALVQLNREGGRATLAVPGVDINDATWYGQMWYTGDAVKETASGVFSGFPIWKTFETKAMRKITGNGQTYTMTAVSNNNTDYQIRAFGNLLLMLP